MFLQAMNDSWIKANESNYIAGASPYPTNEKMQGSMYIYVWLQNWYQSLS